MLFKDSASSSSKNLKKAGQTFCFGGAVLVSDLELLWSFQKLASESKMLDFHRTEMDVQASCQLSACHEQGRLLFGLHAANEKKKIPLSKSLNLVLGL